MRAHLGALAVGAMALAMGFWFLTAGNSGAANDKGDARTVVQNLADTVAKGDAEQAKTMAAEYAKDGDLEAVMYLMKKRENKGKAKGYFGVGKEPGSVQPDGIEAKIQGLGKKPPSQAQLDKESEALVEMAYRIAAIAEIAKAKPSEKANNAAKKKDWAEFAQSMRSGADELAEAAKEKKGPAIKAAASKIYSSCNNCHGSFRDD
jgi:Cytochrome C'